LKCSCKAGTPATSSQSLIRSYGYPPHRRTPARRASSLAAAARLKREPPDVRGAVPGWRVPPRLLARAEAVPVPISSFS
jgi:hypothetical protein